MSEKIKIETVNKISQIYSIDVHCDPLNVDVHLELDKNITATSDPMRDEDSAKSNAYTKAKSQFKVDVIVDPSFIIRTTYSNNIFALISAITFGVFKFGVRYIVTITGYAGYYKNPKSFYEFQKQQLFDLSSAVENAFSDSPKLTSDERKLIENQKSGNVNRNNIMSIDPELLKKYNQIQNKTRQTDLLKSVFFPNSDSIDYDLLSSSNARTGVLRRKISNPFFNFNNITRILRPLIIIGILYSVFSYSSEKYQSWKSEWEEERLNLETYSNSLLYRVESIRDGFNAFTKSSVDSLEIVNIIWEYKPEKYQDSVEKYDKIRMEFLNKYTTEFLPKIYEFEKSKFKNEFIENISSYIGLFSGYLGEKKISISIDNIDTLFNVSGYDYYYGSNVADSAIKMSLLGKVIFQDPDVIFELKMSGIQDNEGVYIFKHKKEFINGEWVNKNLEKQPFQLYKNNITSDTTAAFTSPTQ